jgi:hypothetical protein
MIGRKRKPKTDCALTREATFRVELAIEKMCTGTLEAMLKFPRSAQSVIEDLFPQEALDACRKGYAAAATEHRFYSPMQCYMVYDDPATRLRVPKWEDFALLAPAQAHMLSVQTYAADVQDYIVEAKDILQKFALVDHVFRWLNNDNATTGAMAYYCPWIRSCLPADMKQYIPDTVNRLREPPQIGGMLASMREANTIVACAAFLPKSMPEYPECGFMLEFSEYNWTSPTGPTVKVPGRTLTPHA